MIALAVCPLIFHKLSNHGHIPESLSLLSQRAGVKTDELVNVKKCKIPVGMGIGGGSSSSEDAGRGLS